MDINEFRPMRRARQQLDEGQSIELLKSCTHGTLALNGSGDYPYAVPLSYVWQSGKIYFHCAVSGKKTDMLFKDERVSFCVVESDEIVPEKLTTYYRSVIVFGRARIIDDKKDKRRALELLAQKYAAGQKGTAEEIDSQLDRAAVVEIKVDHLSGKQSIELCRAQSN